MIREKLKYLLPALLAAVLIAGFAINSSQDKPNNTTESDSKPPNNRTVIILADKFTPQELTIKKGETVTFINRDSDDRWPASDDHPSHQRYSQFDPKHALAPGEKWSFTFDRSGTWEYHDHIYPSLTGKIKVTE